MEVLIMTAQLLLSLSILIVVHEWGHYYAARTFHIRVEKFYLFFDFLFPMANVANFALFKKKKGETEYGIGWFPLGGYVKIAGMVDESMDKEQMKQPAQPWEFRSKPAWQRLIVMLGGIIVNLVVGVLIFIGITYFIGDKFILNDYVNAHGGVYAQELAQQIGIQTGDKVVKINGKPFDYFDDLTKTDALLSQNSYYTVLRGDKEIDISIPANFIENFGKKDALGKFLLPRRPIVVDEIAKDSIAGKAGLQKGDKIVELNGHPVAYFDELREGLKNRTGDSITFKVMRGEQLLSYKEYFKGHTNIGFALQPLLVPAEGEKEIHYSLGQSILIGPGRAFSVITVQLKAFGKIFRNELSLKNSLSGPIGMAKMYGGVWDWERFWRMTGLLSMVLAFMNLIPIPGLDGGYVLFLLFEMITGKAPSEKVLENAVKIGMAILLLLMVIVFYNDIARIFTGN
ncbi:MAG: RIP metalloprotease RseP [Bacteroidetes bacterium]|nr:RIP metalloprotease RseP [Bacteroidota bacterium]